MQVVGSLHKKKLFDLSETGSFFSSYKLHVLVLLSPYIKTTYVE